MPGRIHPGLVGVAGQLPAVDGPGGVPSPPARRDRVAGPDPAGPQRLRLPIPQIPGIQAGRRIHRDQRQHLQQVGLDHVHQGAGAVVIPGPVLQRQRLVEHDIHPLDVIGAPQRLEQPVREPQPQQVQHRRLAQEMVHPVDLILRHQGADDGIQIGRAGLVDTEWFLQHQSRTRRQ